MDAIVGRLGQISSGAQKQLGGGAPAGEGRRGRRRR
jgi:hypothetical protein